jgi:hypothetical protein
MDECDIIIYTLGIHYDARGEMIGSRYGKNTFVDDFQAAVTSLADFSNNGKIAIWRSILPQHFDSSDGHFPHTEQDAECKPFQNDNVHVFGNHTPIQNFNKVASQEFARHCHLELEHSCQPQHKCKMNITATNCRTVYKHLLENNLTVKADTMKKLYENNDGIVTGNILHWDIADLFDVPDWHAGNSDCSHFCYIPALYEEAFRRLHWLLAEGVLSSV